MAAVLKTVVQQCTGGSNPSASAMNSIGIVLPILTLLMFDLGLSLRLEDFGKVLRHPRHPLLPDDEHHPDGMWRW